VSTPNWISAITAIPYSDVFATGSNDGTIKLWKVVNNEEFHHIKDIPMVGWVNSLKFSKEANILAVGIGRDHRLGRWSTNKKAKNGICLVPI